MAPFQQHAAGLGASVYSQVHGYGQDWQPLRQPAYLDPLAQLDVHPVHALPCLVFWLGGMPRFTGSPHDERIRRNDPLLLPRP
jgi:uncharacterized membrane protein YGL010W